MKHIRPEDRLHFLRHKEESKRVDAMAGIYSQMRNDGVPRVEAFYVAYFETHPYHAGQFADYCAANGRRFDVLDDPEEDRFHTIMVDMVKRAVRVTIDTIKQFFEQIKEALMMHNFVRNCVDPCELLEIAALPGEHVPGVDRYDGNSHHSINQSAQFGNMDVVGMQRITDARKIMTIACQLLSEELADPEAKVREDLREIDRLSWERLFKPGESHSLHPVCELDMADYYRVKDFRSDNGRVWVFEREDDAFEKAMLLREQGLHPKCEALPWKCRVVRCEERSYVVYAIDRAKHLESALRKLESGRSFNDLRGVKYVVVAVEEHDGTLRPGRRSDAIAFCEIVRERLWHTELIEREDPDPPSRDRHASYWDVKVEGDLHIGRVIGSVEMIVTSLADYLTTKYSYGADSHYRRRRMQIIRYLCPVWWPEFNWSTLDV